MMDKMEREAAMKKIGEIRRALGLSHIAFARALNMPAWQIEIAEHGVWVCSNGEMMRLTLEDLVPELKMDALLKKITQTFRLSEKKLRKAENADMPDACESVKHELTFYFPLTISLQFLNDELDELLSSLNVESLPHDVRRKLEKDGLENLMLHYRIFFDGMLREGKREAAMEIARKMVDRINWLQAM